MNDTYNRILEVLDKTPITDMHTHLYPCTFWDLDRWGIDSLLTYHYLVVETLRYVDIPYQRFFSLDKKTMASLVWDTLFIKHSPVSEAAIGVLTVLEMLGLDTSSRNLDEYRRYFQDIDKVKYQEIILEKSGITDLVMTNWPLKREEFAIWKSGKRPDKRFHPALRIDPLITEWTNTYLQLRDMGYEVSSHVDKYTKTEIQRFISDWLKLMDPVYLCASLPPSFSLAESSTSSVIFEECIIPVMADKGIPVAIMMGAKKGINPELLIGGDGEGKASIEVLEYLCSKYHDLKFLVTMLSRENMHELAVVARKFRNLMPFGCWWFMNNPSLIDELIRMRLEMLGTSFIPQHSDAIVLDQLLYKWAHTKPILARALADQYDKICNTGFKVSIHEIERDCALLMHGNFWNFIKQ